MEISHKFNDFSRYFQVLMIEKNMEYFSSIFNSMDVLIKVVVKRIINVRKIV